MRPLDKTLPILRVKDQDAEDLGLGQAAVFAAQEIAGHLAHQFRRMLFFQEVEVTGQDAFHVCRQDLPNLIRMPLTRLFKGQLEV